MKTERGNEALITELEKRLNVFWNKHNKVEDVGRIWVQELLRAGVEPSGAEEVSDPFLSWMGGAEICDRKNIGIPYLVDPLFRFLGDRLLWMAVILWNETKEDYEYRLFGNRGSGEFVMEGAVERLERANRFADSEFYKTEVSNLSSILFRRRADHGYLAVPGPVAILADDKVKLNAKIPTVDGLEEVFKVFGENYSKIFPLSQQVLSDEVAFQKLRMLTQVFRKNGEVNESVNRAIDTIRRQKNVTINRIDDSYNLTQSGFYTYLAWLYWMSPSWEAYIYLPAPIPVPTGGFVLALKDIRDSDQNSALIDSAQRYCTLFFAQLGTVLRECRIREEEKTRARLREMETRRTAVAGFSHQVGHVLGAKSNFALYPFSLKKAYSERALGELEIDARDAQIRYAALLPRAFEDAIDEPSEVLRRWQNMGNQQWIGLQSLMDECWNELGKPILEIVKEKSSEHGSHKRPVILLGWEDAPALQVPNLEVIRAALFEAIWNAFDHGQFQDKGSAVVKVVYPREIANTCAVEIRNPADEMDDCGEKRSGGASHVKAMLENLAASVKDLPIGDPLRALEASNYHSEFDSKTKEWKVIISLGARASQSGWTY